MDIVVKAQGTAAEPFIGGIYAYSATLTLADGREITIRRIASNLKPQDAANQWVGQSVTHLLKPCQES